MRFEHTLTPTVSALLERIPDVAAAAAAFFRSRGRDFAWRSERDPYKLAVAEILLQKTRAKSAARVYDALVSRFPNAQLLFDASKTELELTLRPLGLSVKRAAQMIGMATAVVEQGESVFHDYRLLLASVPGMGAYAARAVACFGAGETIGIVDANVARIFRRVFSVPSADPRAVVYQRIADAVAAAGHDPREVNFGLLDLGAIVCVRKPLCLECPLAEFCPRFGVS